jgi:hypothetical protein
LRNTETVLRLARADLLAQSMATSLIQFMDGLHYAGSQWTFSARTLWTSATMLPESASFMESDSDSISYVQSSRRLREAS